MQIIMSLIVVALSLAMPGLAHAQLVEKKILTLEAADMPIKMTAMPKVNYFPAAQVNKAFEKGMPLLEIANYKVHASHRDAPGVVEVHKKDTDIIYMLEGSATLVTGGTIVGGKNTEPEEIRGNDVKGGEIRTITKGDVIVVPHGTPHWFKEVKGPLNYYVVKVHAAN